jgi:hypothetical protein
MAGFHNVISTLNPNGEEIMGRGPVVVQSINQIVQVTPLEQVNERIYDISELWRHE